MTYYVLRHTTMSSYNYVVIQVMSSCNCVVMQRMSLFNYVVIQVISSYNYVVIHLCRHATNVVIQLCRHATNVVIICNTLIITLNYNGSLKRFIETPSLLSVTGNVARGTWSDLEICKYVTLVSCMQPLAIWRHSLYDIVRSSTFD